MMQHQRRMKISPELMKAMVECSKLSQWAIYKRIKRLQKEHQLASWEATWLCADQVDIDLSKFLEDEELIEARKIIKSLERPLNSNVLVNNGGIISNSPIRQDVNVSKIRRNNGRVKQGTKTAGSKRKSVLEKILTLASTLVKLIFLIIRK